MARIRIAMIYMRSKDYNLAEQMLSSVLRFEPTCHQVNSLPTSPPLSPPLFFYSCYCKGLVSIGMRAERETRRGEEGCRVFPKSCRTGQDCSCNAIFFYFSNTTIKFDSIQLVKRQMIEEYSRVNIDYPMRAQCCESRRRAVTQVRRDAVRRVHHATATSAIVCTHSPTCI